MRAAALALALAACYEPTYPLGLPCGPAGYCPSGQECVIGTCRDVDSTDELVERRVPVVPNRDIDVLFVIDNSGSMAQEQAALAVGFPRLVSTLESIPGGLPNLHLGVVSSNVGLGTYTGQSSCPVGGDRGRLQNTARVSGCTPPSGYFISDIDNPGARLKNYSGTLSDTFTCIASLGTNGCSFEQHLESMKLALDPLNPVVENLYFLRDDAFLAVVVLADEDDCSAADPTVFDPTQDDMTSTLGPFGSFRCMEFGVECCAEPGAGCTPQVLARTPATYNGPCQPRRDSYLRHPEEYATFLRGLKGETLTTPLDASLVRVVAIAGPPAPFATTLDATSGEPKVVPSCTSGMGTADPGVRLTSFVDLLGGSWQSICQDDLSPALDTITGAVRGAVDTAARSCLGGWLVDRDPGTPALDFDCQVSLDTDGVEAVLPVCADGAARPCWRFESDATTCVGLAHDTRLTIDWTGMEPAGEIVVRCLVLASDA